MHIPYEVSEIVVIAQDDDDSAARTCAGHNLHKVIFRLECSKKLDFDSIQRENAAKLCGGDEEQSLCRRHNAALPPCKVLECFYKCLCMTGIRTYSSNKGWIKVLVRK